MLLRTTALMISWKVAEKRDCFSINQFVCSCVYWYCCWCWIWCRGWFVVFNIIVYSVNYLMSILLPLPVMTVVWRCLSETGVSVTPKIDLHTKFKKQGKFWILKFFIIYCSTCKSFTEKNYGNVYICLCMCLSFVV